jgi:hypothetical protein
MMVCHECVGTGENIQTMGNTNCPNCNGTGKISQPLDTPTGEGLLKEVALKLWCENTSENLNQWTFDWDEATINAPIRQALKDAKFVINLCQQSHEAEISKLQGRVKELEIQTQSCGDCDKDIRADERKKIGDWLDELEVCASVTGAICRRLTSAQIEPLKSGLTPQEAE